MPNVVVYVPAAAWRGLEEAGRDPKLVVREIVTTHLYDPALFAGEGSSSPRPELMKASSAKRRPPGRESF